MKKIILFGFVAALAFTSCEPKETPPEAFPTDGLTIDKRQNVLVLEKTSTGCQTCPTAAEKMKIEVGTWGNQIVGMAAHEGDLLEVLAGKTLLFNFLDTIGAPTILVMNEDAGLDPANAVLAALLPPDLPYFGVKHAIVKTDSSYNVYAKIEVLNDINNETFFVQSYLLLDAVAAKDYGTGLDLNQASSVPIVSTGSGTNPTKWALDAAIVDGEATVKSGDVYNHERVIFGVGMNSIDIWGHPLGQINPFAKEFIKGDILGTKYTPILLSIPKVDLTPLETSMSFVTIVWKYRADGSGFYDYINGYSSKLN